jgi:hypothetical protein
VLATSAALKPGDHESFGMSQQQQQMACTSAPRLEVLASLLLSSDGRQGKRPISPVKDDGDLGRVSINHRAVGERKDARRRAKETTTMSASGNQLQMISPMKSKSVGLDSQQQIHIDTTTTATPTTNTRLKGRETARGETRHRMPVAGIALMVASIVSCANLIDQCNCDTNSVNPFSGQRHSQAIGGYAAASTSPGLRAAAFFEPKATAAATTTATMTHQRLLKPDDSKKSRRNGDRITARLDTPPTSSMKDIKERLLSSMAESIERQHLGLSGHSNSKPTPVPASASASMAKPSKFDGHNSLEARREVGSLMRHDDFMKDILASHERKQQQRQTNADGYKGPKSTPGSSGSSKADQEFRQIMQMHEQASQHLMGSTTNKHKSAYQQRAPPGLDKADTDKTLAVGSGATRWPLAKFSSLPKLSKDFIAKAKLVSIVPEKVFAGTNLLAALNGDYAHRARATQQASSSSAVAATATKTTTTTTIGPSFTPRANAKNHFMGPLLGLGETLLSRPKPTLGNRNLFGRHVGTGGQQQPNYSKPTNEFRVQNLKGSKAKRRGAEVLASDESVTSLELASGGSHDWHPDSVLASKNKNSTQKNSGHGKGGWLVDGAAHLAQTYFKDSFRDLLTLSQLPILSGGPVSTAPSDLEPGGKKWLANKQAAEQMRGNRTNAMEDLLRYLYILTNVGVRRKRDPLKALGSNTYSRPSVMGSLSTSGSNLFNKRPLLSLLADKPVTSLIKLPPPKMFAGSKLGSLIIPNSDHIRSRGVMWDMATDPTLAVTIFHMLERASVALPLGKFSSH